MRSGTLATHQIVGFGVACRIAAEAMPAERVRLTALRERLWQGLQVLPGIYLNGSPSQRVPGILNVSFEGAEGESLRAMLPELMLSSGSACSSATDRKSTRLNSSH